MNKYKISVSWSLNLWLSNHNEIDSYIKLKNGAKEYEVFLSDKNSCRVGSKSYYVELECYTEDKKNIMKWLKSINGDEIKISDMEVDENEICLLNIK